MSDPGDRADRPGGRAEGGDGETVGSVGEEAAKLFGALSDWARVQAPGRPEPSSDEPAGGTTSAGPAAQAREALADGVARGLHGVGEHLATGSGECRYCPVCQVIHVVRQTSPEVRAQLTSAAGSLLQAAAGMLATPTPQPGGRGPVERIDLDGDDPGDRDHRTAEHAGGHEDGDRDGGPGSGHQEGERPWA